MVHSPAHAFSYFSKGNRFCLPSLSYVEPAFLHRGSAPYSRFDPPLSREDVALARLDSLPFQDLVICTDGCSFSFRQRRLWRTCQLLTVALWPPFPCRQAHCSTFSAEVFAILQAFCWFRQHQQVCHFSSLSL